jgi:hypothetical protein
MRIASGADAEWVPYSAGTTDAGTSALAPFTKVGDAVASRKGE